MKLEIMYQDRFGKYKTKTLENVSVIPRIGDFVSVQNDCDNREVNKVSFYYEEDYVFIETRM